MFALEVSWLELVVRVTIIYVALLVLVRLSGKRTVGQFTPFDLLVVMLLSEAVSNGLTGSEDSVTGALIAAATLLGLNGLVSRATARSEGLRRLAEGTPVVVGYEGRILEDRLKQEHVTREDLLQALREADVDVHEMKLAVLEADGKFSVLKDAKATARTWTSDTQPPRGG
jgi:uncharacterized membrane protein YcaP (DUF421 family)